MAGDARTKHLKRLRRLRRSARGWSVRAGLLVGATAVLVPYRGLGWPDAIWAALAGGSAAFTAWRWKDYRELAAEPVPPALSGPQDGKLAAAVRRFAVGRSMIDEVDRQRSQARFRGLSVAEHWRRLDRACLMLDGLSGRLGPFAETAVLDAAVAEKSLRDLCERIAVVERTMRLGQPAGDQLRPAHEALVAQLESGVSGYEQFVAAAAACVAQEPDSASTTLADATAFLRGMSEGLNPRWTTGNATTP
jgi:hypothetical protein